MPILNQEVSVATLPMIRAAEAGKRGGTPGERGAANATKAVSRKWAILEATGLAAKAHPATGDTQYDANRTEFLMAVDAWKRTTGRNFPHVTDYLDIAESLGWSRATLNWPSDRELEAQIAALEADVA